jgi:hypothetical protein
LNINYLIYIKIYIRDFAEGLPTLIGLTTVTQYSNAAMGGFSASTTTMVIIVTVLAPWWFAVLDSYATY